jgi:phosphohistidine phosphatase
MELLIIRHAIAAERDAQRWRDDDSRPLTPLGMRRSRRAAAGLQMITHPPDRLLTSPLVRARQTAQILTEVAGWPPAEEVPELLPGRAALKILTVLAKNRRKRIALVGHQPDLGILLAACLLGNHAALPVDLKKNAVACVAFQGPARAGQGVLRWLATPRMLRVLRHD